MKKIWFILCLCFILLGVRKVAAKDIIHSINKYSNETFLEIKEGYDKNGKHDGFVVAGLVLKDMIEYKESTYDDTQIVLIKYAMNGKISWNTMYGKTKEDRFIDLEYTYKDREIDGYLLVVEKTFDIEEDSNKQVTFLKYDLEGNLVLEKDSSIDLEKALVKIISLKNGGYVGFTKNSVICYDGNLAVLWVKEVGGEVLDLAVSNDKDYAFLEKQIDGSVDLISINSLGSEIKKITSLKDVPYVQLESLEDGFLLYGITSMVKLRNSDTSYFLTKYRNDYEEVWDIVGNQPVSDKERVFLQVIEDGFYIGYRNNSDQTYEVIELNNEGLYKKKVKKIRNNYYYFEDFITHNDTIYFVGKMNCPDEDNCDYTHKSLFLQSDEEKVIEVEQEDNSKIILLSILLLLFLGMVFIRRKKRR